MIDDSYDPEYTILSQGSLKKLQEKQQDAERESDEDKLYDK